MGAEDDAAAKVQAMKRGNDAQKVVAAKRAEAGELAAKKGAEDMAAAQAVLGGAAKGYKQRKAAREEKVAIEQGAKHIQAQIRGRKERKDPASEANVRRERNKQDPRCRQTTTCRRTSCCRCSRCW